MQTFSKKLLLLLIIVTTISTASAAPRKQNRDYVNATDLTIINKVLDNGASLKRLDISQFDIPQNAKYYLSISTGVAIVFRTDSPSVGVRWTTSSNRPGANTNLILHSGLDIYIKEGNKWVFAGVARPKPLSKEHESIMVNRMEEGVKECMIYLPMFNGIPELEISVNKGSYIEAIPSPFKHKIVFVGSSITHGASASRPGASYVARLGRALNAETPNIGMSGRCKLDDYFADIVCAAKADAFVFDAFSNSTDKMIEERLDYFVKRITTAHPNTPMIFLQTIKRDIGHFDLGARKRNDNQREAAEREMAKVCQKYRNVYFINPGLYVGEDHEGTVDGTHLNDLGTQRTIEMVLPKLKKILKKYGIR